MSFAHFSLQESVCEGVESGLDSTVSRRRSPWGGIGQYWVLTDDLCVTWAEPRDLLRLPERRVFLWQKPRGAVRSEPRRGDQSEDSGQHGLQVAGVSRIFSQIGTECQSKLVAVTGNAYL